MIVYLAFYIVIVQALTIGSLKDQNSVNFKIQSLISKLDFFIKSKTTSFFNILTSRTSNCVVCTFQLPSLLKHPLTFILFYFIWGDA